VIDLTEVPHLGVSASLAIETTIREAVKRGCPVYLAGLGEQPRKRFESLGVPELVPVENWIRGRVTALQQAVADRARPA
jgi:SulP family sulfate permease